MHLQYYALAAAACLVSVSVAFVPAANPLRRSGPLRAIARRIVDEKAFSNAMYELKKAGAETGPETKKICDGACGLLLRAVVSPLSRDECRSIFGPYRGEPGMPPRGRAVGGR